MTGPFAPTGKQIEAAARLYMAQNGETVGGKKVELIVKDDTSAPDVTKRIAQELVVNDKVNVLAGFGLTPLALATAPIATQSKTPLVVMAAATSSITEASPFIIRTSFTLPQALSLIHIRRCRRIESGRSRVYAVALTTSYRLHKLTLSKQQHKNNTLYT